jgi:thioredoxin-dependent peroxiredoxin
MKRILLVLAVLALSIGTSRGEGAVGGAELKPGDVAPPFTMKGSDGKDHTLADQAGKRAVVLAWFPKAFTGG